MSSPATTTSHHGRSSWLALLGFLAAVVVVAVVGGVAASGSAATYADLELPAFAPPSWLFGPVWTVLYVMIAVSGWLVWRAVGVDRAMVPYAVQLVLNAAWTPLFFAADEYAVALVEIIVLLVTIGVCIAMFGRRSRAAALLMLPYAAWVTFATALNASIWWLNR